MVAENENAVDTTAADTEAPQSAGVSGSAAVDQPAEASEPVAQQQEIPSAQQTLAALPEGLVRHADEVMAIRDAVQAAKPAYVYPAKDAANNVNGYYSPKKQSELVAMGHAGELPDLHTLLRLTVAAAETQRNPDAQHLIDRVLQDGRIALGELAALMIK